MVAPSSSACMAEFMDKHQPESGVFEALTTSKPNRVFSIHNARIVVGSSCFVFQPGLLRHGLQNDINDVKFHLTFRR